MPRRNDPNLQELLAQYQRQYRELTGPVMDQVRKYIDDGLDVDKAVQRALSESGLWNKNQEMLVNSLVSAVADGAGAGVRPSDIKTTEVKRILLSKAWAPDKMNLSKRLHGASAEMRQTIVDTISTAMRLSKSWVGMARDLYDGYNGGKKINQADLPEYMDRLVKHSRRVLAGDIASVKKYQAAAQVAQRQINRLAEDGAPTKALKAAYSQLFEATQDLSAKAIDNAVRVAIEEKSRYIAERIARTEISAAWGDGFFVKHQADPDVIAYRWKLNSRHPRYDICDIHASVDLYGLGPGVYPKDKYPRRPAHTHCMCPIEPVYVGELHPDPAEESRMIEGAKFNPKSMNEFIDALPRDKQLQLFGEDGLKAWEHGESWQKHLRAWSGHFDDQGRLTPDSFNVKMKVDTSPKPFTTLPEHLAATLKESYGIANGQVAISDITIKEVPKKHPEFAGSDLRQVVDDIIANASFLQRNQFDDVVRVIAVNEALKNPLPFYSGDKLLVLILKLANKHPMNFVKSLYPRDKIKGGDFLWSKSKE